MADTTLQAELSYKEAEKLLYIPHRGFAVFNDLFDKYSPKYFIHGHVHLNYGSKFKRITQYKDTTIINAYIKHIFEY